MCLRCVFLLVGYSGTGGGGCARRDSLGPSASTCINTSSRLRSRLVAAILDSRDGLSIRRVCTTVNCVARYLGLSKTGYRRGV